jgi:flagellar biosynthesis anti-sigma factor FlgM
LTWDAPLPQHCRIAALRIVKNLPIEKGRGSREFMRVDFTTFGVEPPDTGKSGHAGQAGSSDHGAGSVPPSTSTSTSSSTSSSPSSASRLDETCFAFDQTRVQSLQAQALAQPEIREAKVQSLQRAIGNGEYSVSTSQVADALISALGGAQN